MSLVSLSPLETSLSSQSLALVRTTNKNNEKSAQWRRNHCALAVVRWNQKFSPRRRPLPGGAGRPKFNQLETATTFTYRPSLVGIDARNFELSGNRPTNTQDRLQ